MDSLSAMLAGVTVLSDVCAGLKTPLACGLNSRICSIPLIRISVGGILQHHSSFVTKFLQYNLELGAMI